MKVMRVIGVWIVIAFSSVSQAIGESPIVDGHNHDAISATGGMIDVSMLGDLKSRGIDVVMVPLPVDRSETSDLLVRIEGELRDLCRLAAETPEFSIAGDLDEVLTGRVGDDVQVLFSIEWFGSVFGEDPGLVESYRDVGVRAIGLTKNDPDTLFGEGELSATLTPHGQRVVSAMNRAGILIDITHLDQQQMLEVIKRSSAPVVATHALAGEVNPTTSNLSVDVLTAMAEHGGSVWISFNKADLLGGRGEQAAIDLLVDHIEVLIERLGVDHVGIGSDLQAGGKYVPLPLNRPDAFLEIRRRLLARGHSLDTVEGVLGLNVLRALSEGSHRTVRTASRNGICAVDGHP